MESIKIDHAGEIYVDAILGQGTKGKPIFFTNVKFYKITSRGNKQVKLFEVAKGVVVSGNLEQIKKDPATLYNALKTAYDKETAHKADRKKYGIDSVEFISFHGYSIEK